MRYILFLLFSLAVFIACRTGSNNASLLHPGNLETTQYVIDTDRDTTLQTKHGALLKIPRGALAAASGHSVTLDIKEAYSMAQMIQGGLTTQSGSDPLSSGGMIYINAAKGQDVTIKQKIQVAIPADFLQTGMQLFKGDERADGRIDWVRPDTLPPNPQQAAINQGKTLFESSCANCHIIGQNAAGPDLRHYLRRFTLAEDFPGYYVHYPHHSFEREYHGHTDTSAYTIPYDTVLNFKSRAGLLLYWCNAMRYNASAGTIHVMAREDLNSIYRYIQNESDRRNLEVPSNGLRDCVDSCTAYLEKTGDLLDRQTIEREKRKELLADNGPMVDFRGDSTWPQGNGQPVNFEEKVSPASYGAEYYQFTIDSFGWINIDMLLNKVEGVQESELFVKVAGEYTDRVKIYLIIPSAKVYGEGGPADRNAAEFAFFYRNGKLPLPQQQKAYILALTEGGGSLAYGLKEFTTSMQQELTIELHAATKDEFTNAMQQFDNNRLHIKVDDAKNADSIRKTDTVLRNIEQQLKKAESLKPKNCDCGCLPKADSIAIAEADFMNTEDAAIPAGKE
ncbi:MAG: hypothetical protein ABW019_18460 [Chitinophagaceae bacterium]